MRSKAEINLANFNSNLEDILKTIPKEKFMAVVKANAYGHGIEEISKFCINKGIKWFGVATYDEAMKLRSISKDIDILILGAVSTKYYSDMAKNNIQFTVTNFFEIEYLNEHNINAKIHIALETGMGRLGFMESELPRVFDMYKPIGIFSHLSSADFDPVYTKKQLEKFDRIVSKYDVKYKHINNSDSIKNFYNPKYDLYRIGILMYKPKPVMSLKARVTLVRKLEDDLCISYGKTYIAKKGSFVAVVGIGYADGVNRRLSNKGQVYLKGKRYNIIGRICMDQLMILADENVVEGDEVEFFGENIKVEEVATSLDTIIYEILCDIGTRVKRVYVKGGNK